MLGVSFSLVLFFYIDSLCIAQSGLNFDFLLSQPLNAAMEASQSTLSSYLNL